MADHKLARSSFDEAILELVLMSEQKTLIIWAYMCADRVKVAVHQKEYQELFAECFCASVAWVYNSVSIKDMRDLSFRLHSVARDLSDDPAAEHAMRALGHAVATAHVAKHAYNASVYAATSVGNIGGDVEVERAMQYELLIDLRYSLSKKITEGGEL